MGDERRLDAETAPEVVARGPSGDRTKTAPRLGLVVLWNSESRDCVGAWLPVARSGHGDPMVFGRGDAESADKHVRLRAVRQLPGTNRAVGPFVNQSLSRRQLVLAARTPDLLEVSNVGRCELLVNGQDVKESQVRPGDVLEIGSQLVLLCARRPDRLPGPPLAAPHTFGQADTNGVVGESPAAWGLRAEIAFAAPHNGHVLVLGATGTGKELAAGALHRLSARVGPFIARNAATLPEAPVNAELFGNRKDYPNPGMPDRKGLVGAADGGTLFLDELADLHASAQPPLLRVLDAGEYQRLGEESTVRRSRFRFIAATNRAVTLLRPELLARFDFRVQVPDLAARVEDVPFIARHLFAKMAQESPEHCARFQAADGWPTLSFTFVRRLTRHPFNANVRELRGLLWASVRASPGTELEWPDGADEDLRTSGESPSEHEGAASLPADESGEMDDGKLALIKEALLACGWSQTRAAERLGVGRRTLSRWMTAYRLPRPHAKIERDGLGKRR
jgi:DNA-binding NtrC family response regulator